MFPERPRNADGFGDDELDFQLGQDDGSDDASGFDPDDLVELDELEDLDAEIPILLAQPPSEPTTGSLAAFADGVVTEAKVAALSDPSRAALRTFARDWMGLPAETRRRIIEAMEDLSETRFDVDFRRIFRLAMQDEDAGVRQLGLRALWGEDSPALARPLLALLADDPSPDVRAEAARTLAPLAFAAETEDLDEDLADEVREGLMAAVRGKDPLVQRIALESAAVFGGEELTDLIQDAYDSGEHDRMGSALFAMGRTHDKAWLSTLLDELESEDALLRYESARALGSIGSDAAVPDLLAAMDGEEDVEVRHAVIAALGEIGGRSAVRALETLAAQAEEADEEAIQDALDDARFMMDESAL